MKPQASPQDNPQKNLYKRELAEMIDMEHELVRLASEMDWSHFDALFGVRYAPDFGRPGVSTRLMVGLHYLKYSFRLSDEGVVDMWVENPYWQYFCGMKFFSHKRPINPSSMTKWRKRIGKDGAEELLKETIHAGLKMGIIKRSMLSRINVDTTVQEKNVRFPTDVRLYDRIREKLVKAAEEKEIELRQNFNRLSKIGLRQHNGYSHAKQMKRARKCARQMRNYLGRVIRDIERKMVGDEPELLALLVTAKRIYNQKRSDKNKVYSAHAPEVECISKGKAHKRYEFGCKVSVAATSKGGWVVGAQACPGNPYDGHTLPHALDQVERISPMAVEHAFVDLGYRGHGYGGNVEVHVCPKRRGGIKPNTWKWMKRRAAVEPTIGHLKRDHGMDCNALKGSAGDMMNAIMSACGLNFSKLLKQLFVFFYLWFEKRKCDKSSSLLPISPTWA